MTKLLRSLRPFMASVIGVIVLVFIQSLTELKLPDLMSEIVDTGIVKGDIPFIWKIGGEMLLVALAGTFCALVAGFLSAKIAAGLGRDLRNKVFAHVEKFSLNEFNKFGTASLITRNTNDIQQVQMVVLLILRMVVSAPMMMIGGIFMAVRKDAHLSLVLVLAVPVLALTIWLVASKTIPLFKAMQVRIDRLNLVVREGLTGIRVVRAFNRIELQHQRFEEANRDITTTAIKVNRIMAVLMPVLMLILNFTTIAIIWFGSIRIDEGQMQVGDMMAFLQYSMQIMFSLILFSFIFVMLPRAAASASRINEVLDTHPEIKDISSGYDPLKDSEIKGLVEFKEVTFSYPGAEEPVLNHITFTAHPGETVAFIGGTGSGKSTLINLIPRFYDVDSGQVLVDGQDVREISQETLRSKLGYVPQKALLFSGSISDNIRYGKKDANEEDIQKAAEIAQATDFIKEMQDGFQAKIAQGGTNVSGGQKQRLSIARALVRKPEIYIFDDSFSALDFKTDAKLRAALKKETGRATILIVAQRVSTIIDADKIVVLDQGHVVGIGKHKELMENCDVYREIVSSQLTQEELA